MLFVQRTNKTEDSTQATIRIQSSDTDVHMSLYHVATSICISKYSMEHSPCETKSRSAGLL